MKSKAAKGTPHSLTPDEEVALIKKTLKIFTTLKPVKYWLDTGNPNLNAVLGSKEHGVPYGKIFELFGNESNGKTAVMLWLMGLAQKDGAKIGLIDLENSWDPEWSRALGLNPDEVYIFRTEIGIIGSEKEERITTAQEIFAVAQRWMANMSARYPNGRIVLGVDSVAAIMTEEDEAAGIQEQNMRTLVSTSSFLSKLLRRWVAVAANRNAMMFFINQMRTTPGAWGNPETTPGGRALKHYAALRIRMSRKGKKLLKEGKPIGIKGTMSNWKNKAGGGSREGKQVGYKLYYRGKIKYVDVDEIKSEAGE